jgi:ribosomal protein L21E
MTNQFGKGAAIRIDIPDTSDPDFDRYHGRTGEIIKFLEDSAGMETGDSRDGTIYRVEFEDGEVADFRWRDLRPL